jgi:hypothetical protein
MRSIIPNISRDVKRQYNVGIIRFIIIKDKAESGNYA